MPYIFDNVTEECNIWFKNSTKVRLEEVYANEWSDSVCENASCLNYRALTLVKKKQKKTMY